MKEIFRTKKFHKRLKIKLSTGNYWQANTYELLAAIIKVIQKYQEKEIIMTLRQLYYQLVAGDIIPNDDKVYKKLSAILTDARYLGLVDWIAIEDRVRRPIKPSEWKSIPDIVKSALYSFRLPRWDNQRYYVELFTEKDALSSILYPLAGDNHITFCVNRGYGSATAIYHLYKRVYNQISQGKEVVILYLGDHDPSGLDMIRDIEDRLVEFLSVGTLPLNFVIEHIALTMEQIELYNPPPNPAKLTDSRAAGYIREFGGKSWEVDALPPDVMTGIVTEAIEKYIDNEKLEQVLIEEKRQKEILEDILETTDWEQGG